MQFPSHHAVTLSSEKLSRFQLLNEGNALVLCCARLLFFPAGSVVSVFVRIGSFQPFPLSCAVFRTAWVVLDCGDRKQTEINQFEFCGDSCTQGLTGDETGTRLTLITKRPSVMRITLTSEGFEFIYTSTIGATGVWVTVVYPCCGRIE